jgi:type I restriction enzyme M protein
MQEVEKDEDNKIASKIFKNSDFGYYKVNIERPKRLKAKLSDKNIETLRYDKSLIEPMKWAYENFKEGVYEDITVYEKEIAEFCEQEGLELKTKQLKSLTSQTLWKKHQTVLTVAKTLQEKIGKDEFDDFNIFKTKVDETLKQNKLKLSSGEKNMMLNAISWYDESAKKVVKKVHKLNNEKLDTLLKHLRCTKEQLANFGYYQSEKEGVFIEYESDTELRDSENIPLDEDIQEYFLKEVKPHVKEAWINLDSVKIGYEISFNRYFYKHKPLRSIEEVTADIVELEKKSEGLIKEILGL